METVRNFLNKLRWDLKYQEHEYSIAYLDRIENVEVILPVVEIIDINQTHLTTNKCVLCQAGKIFEIEMYTYIPFHRIKKIYKNSKIVYSR